MGKSLPSASTLENFARAVASQRINPSKQPTAASVTKSNPRASVSRVDPTQVSLKMDSTSSGQTRSPLSHVVSDCVKRWFQDTLKEAKSGDAAMQLLVGQMYNSGYGVRKDTDKGRTWISRASKGRSSAWKVSNKQPGYNASDSESEDVKSAKG